MSATSPHAGWFGKLPSLGDFAQRRLPPEFVEVWDDWLGAELARVRVRYDNHWLEAYLASPVWRFVLMPGALTPAAPAWAGVLMPSVDKVGRYFPLTIVHEIGTVPERQKDSDTLLAWLHDLDDVAADALQEDWSLDQLEQVLTSRAAPVPTPFDPEDTVFDIRTAGAPSVMGMMDLSDACDDLRVNGGPGLMMAAPPRGEIARVLALQVAQARRGMGFWWCDVPGDSRVMLSRGLPTHRLFDTLFGLDDGRDLQDETS